MGTWRSRSRAVRVICSSRAATFRVVVEELVEVAHAEEEQGIGILRLAAKYWRMSGVCPASSEEVGVLADTETPA